MGSRIGAIQPEKFATKFSLVLCKKIQAFTSIGWENDGSNHWLKVGPKPLNPKHQDLLLICLASMRNDVFG